MDKIQEELKRYNMIIDQDAISVEEVWCEHGYYVRFSDIKDILKSRDEEIKKEINTEIKQCALTCENLWIDNFSGVSEQYQCAEAIMKRIRK